MELKIKNRHINGGLLNIQSVTNKGEFIQEVINEYDLDFLVLTETWLNGNPSDKSKIKELKPEAFRFFHIPRKSRGGGGVGVILKKCFKNVSIREININPTTFEVLDLSCYVSNRKLRIIVIYRSPSTSVSLFMEEIENFLEQLDSDFFCTLICGDFNLWMDDLNQASTKNFNNILETLNLVNKVHTPTSRSNHILDLVITNDVTNLASSVTSEKIGNLVHSLVKFNVNILRIQNVYKTISYRCKRDFIPDEYIKSCYIELMQSTEDLCVCDDGSQDGLLKKDCVNCFCNSYNTLFHQQFNLRCPLKCKKINLSKDAPWFNNEIKEARKLRRRRELAWRASKDDLSRAAFNEARNEVCRLIKKAKKSYYNNKLQEYSKDSKKLNSMFNDILGNNSELTLPVSDDDNQLADEFATFFDNKVLNIVESLTSAAEQPTNNDILDPPGAPVILLEEFDRITDNEMKMIIANSKKSYNNNDPYPIKSVINAKNFQMIIEIFTHIVNLSWNSRTFPLSEKIGIVNPLYKGEGNANELRFYRPVTNLSFLSKIIEKATILRMNAFIQVNNILPPMQSAYRKSHSTETTVTAVINDLLLELDNDKCCLMFMLDLSAAFDTVDHSLLIKDLIEIGLGTNITEWFKSYLSDRSFNVKINESFSKLINLPRGVPQGSVGGPILFSIYNRRLSEILRSMNIPHKLFADDSQGYHAIQCFEEDVKVVVETVMKCKAWLQKRLQKLNEGKTKFMFIGKQCALDKLKTDNDVTIVEVNGENVDTETVLKNLGTWFDQHLSMKNQVLAVVKSTHYQLRNISYVRKYLNIDSLKMISTQQILSRLDYCNTLYAGLPKCLLKKLQVVMNKTAKMIVSADITARASPILIDLHWLPIIARIEYKICCLVHTAIHTGFPSYLRALLQPLYYHNAVGTRNSNDPWRLVEPRVNGNYGSRSFKYIAPRKFNKLPRELRGTKDPVIFKKMLKTLLFSRAFDLENKCTNAGYKV